MATSNTAVAVGEVSTTKGEVFAKGTDGQMRRLAVGDKIFEGEVIVTANGSSVEVNMFNGPALHVAEQQSVTVDSQVSSHAHDATAGAISAIGSTEAAKAIQTVNAGDAQDFNKVLDDQATAAGLTGGDGGGGHGFVDLVRIVENVPTSGFSFPSNPSGTAPTIQTLSGAPTDTLTAQISIDPVFGNNIINNQQAQQPTTTITGTVTAVSTSAVNAGEIVTLTVNGNNYFGTVVQNPTTGALTYSIPVNISDLVAHGTAHSISVSVTMTDTGGNTTPSQVTSTASVTPILDTLAASVHLAPITGDNIINNVEAQSATTTITGTVGGNAHAGDTVTLTIGTGVNAHTVTATVDANLNFSTADNAVGNQVLTSWLADGTSVSASVLTTDAAGSLATASDSVTVTTDTLAASVHLAPITGDNIINNVEAQSATTTITGTVGGNAHTGDTVTLTIGTGDNAHTVTATVGSDGQSFSTAGNAVGNQVLTSWLSNGTTVNANVSISDAAGSKAAATASETVLTDSLPPGNPHILLNPVEPNNAPGFTNTIYSNETQNIVISGTVGTVHSGDAVILTVGSHSVTIQDTTPNSLFNFSTSIDSSWVSNGTLITAVVTDAAGSISTTKATETVLTDQSGASVNLVSSSTSAAGSYTFAPGVDTIVIPHTPSGTATMYSEVNGFGTNDTLNISDILSHGGTVKSIVTGAGSSTADVNLTEVSSGVSHSDIIHIVFNAALSGSQQLSIDTSTHLIKITG